MYKGEIRIDRAGFNDLNKAYQSVQSIQHIKDILDALPYLAAVLNPQRQIIYSNNHLLKELGNISMEQILGKRPGEALNCIYAIENDDGCGSTENCRYCGALNAILESQQSGKKIIMECRITASVDNNLTAYDFSVTATPLIWDNVNYTILALKDISHEKRRQALERIFFHDIINKAGSLSSYIDIIKDIKNPDEIRRFLSTASAISDELVEEIIAQRELIDAENNELKTNLSTTFSYDLLKTITDHIMHHPVAKNKIIEIDSQSDNIAFEVDDRLIKRVLTNMLKNALEATNENGHVKLGCTQNNQHITFWVKNKGNIPKNEQMQIFQRSFSTKGTGRGLGTYSMKMLGEQYLKGKVWFYSSKSDDTTFYIELPIFTV
jgi:K+-sensing histidine kinase KdpD